MESPGRLALTMRPEAIPQNDRHRNGEGDPGHCVPYTISQESGNQANSAHDANRDRHAPDLTTTQVCRQHLAVS